MWIPIATEPNVSAVPCLSLVEKKWNNIILKDKEKKIIRKIL